ncbi:MAG: hypothetical protein ACOVP2_03020, partial [Armatimonadaceae bacterium]
MTFHAERIQSASTFTSQLQQVWDEWAAATAGATAMQRWAWVGANIDRVPKGMFVGIILRNGDGQPVAAAAFKWAGPG